MSSAALDLRDSRLALGGRLLWSELTLESRPSEFLPVIGPNGAGKTSFLKVLLGLLRAEGGVLVLGARPRRGNPRVGYVPQQKAIDPDLPLRGRDLVRMGVDGERWGPPLPSAASAARVQGLLDAVGAAGYADRAVGRLSGGEQQRLRVAQALAGEPQLLLCDEPLLSLDLHHQSEVVDLIAGWRERSGGTVVFVTHDVNPVLEVTDRVLALVGGRFALGTPAEVLTTATLSRLYGSPVEVIHHRGRLVVLSEVGDPAGAHHHPHHETASTAHR